MKTPGLRTRLTLWHAAAVALILAVVGAAADWWLARVIQSQVDATLILLAETEAASALDQVAEGEPLIHLHDVDTATGGPTLRRLDKLVQVVAADDGRVLARSFTPADVSLPAPPALLERLRRHETVVETLPDWSGEPVRLVSLPIDVDGRLRYAFQVGTSLRPMRSFLTTARLLFLTASAAILAGVVGIGALLADRALRPIDRVVARAHAIEQSTLHERLPHPGTGDEIGRLVETLNDMLGRLETSFEVQRRFTADAAHELRSPLSRLRTELEVTLQRPRDGAEYEAVLRSCVEEVERLAHLTEELLTLARLDAGEDRVSRTASTALADVVDDVLGRLASHADQARVVLVHEPGGAATVAVAPSLLALAVGNLVENALKFSPPGGRVTVRTDRAPDAAVLAVGDEGPGVILEDRERIFDRFYRSPTAASPDTPGVGLGLAIVRAIVEAHGGTVHVDGGAGATFTVRLPLAA